MGQEDRLWYVRYADEPTEPFLQVGGRNSAVQIHEIAGR